jgi:hypothetical protein
MFSYSDQFVEIDTTDEKSVSQEFISLAGQTRDFHSRPMFSRPRLKKDKQAILPKIFILDQIRSPVF